MVAPGWAKRVPPSASTNPAAIFSKVDLPEPLRPTRHRRSPSPTRSSAPSSRRVPPKATVMSLRCKSGGMARYVRGWDAAIKRNLARPGRDHDTGAGNHFDRVSRPIGQAFAVEIQHPDIALHRTLHQKALAILAPHHALAGMADLAVRHVSQLASITAKNHQLAEHGIVIGSIAYGGRAVAN